MKIVFYLGFLSGGGAEREVIAFANAMAKAGEEVHIVYSYDAEDTYAVDERVHLHKLQYSTSATVFKTLFNIRDIARQIRAFHADTILPIYSFPTLYAGIRLAVLFSKTKVICTVRNNLEKKFPDLIGKWSWRIESSLANGIWVQTQEQRKFFPKFLQKRIFEVHNILDGRFLDIPRAPREKIRNFINVGRIHPQKNQKMLVEAFAQMLLRTGDQDATLTIYGSVGEREHDLELELRALISRYHLEDRVFLSGRVADIETKYAEADAFVFSSDYEGCPNALMEAMAAGLPCISTDCPTGPSVIIESGKNGLLVPVGHAEAMSQAMESLISNPQMANAMGMAAKQRMKEWENVEELSGQFLKHLRGVCGKI